MEGSSGSAGQTVLLMDQSNMISWIKNLRSKNDDATPLFSDFTLFTSDGEKTGKFPAHKLILAAASSYFEDFFRESPELPSMRLSNVNENQCKILLDLIYKGKATIPDNENESLLQLARHFKIKNVQFIREEPEGNIDNDKPAAKRSKFAPGGSNTDQRVPTPSTSQTLESIDMLCINESESSRDENIVPENAVAIASENEGEQETRELFATYICGASFNQLLEVTLEKESEGNIVSDKPAPKSSRVEQEVQVPEGILNDPLQRKDHFYSKSVETAHIKIHLREKSYKCIFCGKEFGRKVLLENHTRIHTNERPFKCDVCNKQFTRKYHLAMHKITHTGHKRFFCEICNKKFTQKSSLQVHKSAIHSRERPYSCPICLKRFTQSGNLSVHMRVHTGERPYFCSHCGRGFTQSSHLNSHNRFVHSMNKV